MSDNLQEVLKENTVSIQGVQCEGVRPGIVYLRQPAVGSMSGFKVTVFTFTSVFSKVYKFKV